MGNEGQGISPEMTAAADILVHISMKGRQKVSMLLSLLVF